MIFRNSFYWEIEIVSCNVKKKIFEILFSAISDFPGF